MTLEELQNEVSLLLKAGVDPKTKITRMVLGRPVEVATISRQDVKCIVEENTSTVKHDINKEVLILK